MTRLPETPEAILADLIACPSVTPDDGGALTLIASWLRPLGFDVHLPVFTASGTPDIVNLYARFGSTGPHLCFAGHTDVVPPGEAARWTHPPFSGAIADGILFGRGAVDMKGGIAAFLSAMRDHLAAGRALGSVSLLITGDEEGPAINGTVKLLEWARGRGERWDGCLLGEPTNPAAIGEMIKVGRRGSLSGTVTVSGRQGHVAYPHLADNPVPGLMRLMQALIAQPLDAGNERFQPSNLEIVSLDVGNPAWNVIPGAARGRFNIRFNDIWTRDSLADWLAQQLRAAAGNDLRYALDLEDSWSASFLTRDDALIRTLSEAIKAVTGRVPALSTSGGTSDARFIKDYCPVVEFGLVGQTMHQIDERVPVADLRLLTEIYATFLNRYFSTC